MKILRQSLIVFLLMFTATKTIAQISDTERGEISTEVANALTNYHRMFSTGTPAEMADQIYGMPLLSVGNNGATTVWSTRAEIITMLTGLVANLKEQGWVRSSMPSPQICVLGSGSGFASGQFIRYREDGSEISRSGMAYVFQKKEEGWKMTTFMAHDANQRLSCSD